MSSLSRELVFFILQFLNEQNCKETAHRLERESGFFFNLRYFGELVSNGEWEEVENYLSGFTKVEDNRYSMKIFFDIRKQKYLEALDRRDSGKALEILNKDLKVFSTFNEDLFKELAQLLTLENFRENEKLSKYTDAKSARTSMLVELKKLIEANPLFHDKLQFPTIRNSRLRTLVNQSLNWQHHLCKNPKANPDMKTLFLDHTCVQPSTPAQAPPPLSNPMMGSILNIGGFSPIGVPGHGPLTASLAGSMPSQSPVPKIWKLTEINDPSQLVCLKLPDNILPVRIINLVYTNSGSAIVALAYNAVHKLWKWQSNERNPIGKATASVPPQLWLPSSGILMTNDISETNLEEAVPCFALSKNDTYVISASGGKISLFNMINFKRLTTFMSPPPAATFVAFHPQDNNIVAIGMEDSSIHIFNVRATELKAKIEGHQRRVTGLAFSTVLSVLVSSGADAQLCVWSLDTWEKKASKFLEIPQARASNPLAHTRVRFHQDQTNVLVVHETQLAVYEARKLECIKQWIPDESSSPITDATYSCDSQSVFASFGDGTVCIFTGGLKMKCRINSGAYFVPTNLNSKVYPLAIAAHPTMLNQFALGLTDGSVHVLEPLVTEGSWGSIPPQEDDAGPSSDAVAASAATTDQ